MGAEEPVLDRDLQGSESVLHAETTGSSGLLLLTIASKLI